MRWSAPVSVRAALILAQGGEDGLLLLTQAMKVGAIENIGQPALLALAATTALGPKLDAAKAPYIAIESNLIRFRRSKKPGHRVAFGDTGQKTLEAAGIARARGRCNV